MSVNEKETVDTNELGDEDFERFFREAAAAADTTEPAAKNDGDKPAEGESGKDEEKADEKTDDKSGEEEASGRTTEQGDEGGEGDAKSAEGESTGEGEQPPAPPAQKTPDPQVAEITARLAKLEEEKAAKAAAEAKEKEKEEPADPPKKFEPQPFEFKPEEKEALEAFTKDWPDIAQAFELRQRQVVHDMQQQFVGVVEKLMSAIEERVAPVIQSQVLSDEERHFAAITKAHSDYDEIIGEVPGWIKTQPKYLQAHLQKVYDEGSTEQVIELLGDFKKATGRVTPQPSERTPAKTQQQKDEPPANKVAALTPTASKRTSVSTRGVNKDDFDAAWEDAIQQQG